MSIHQMPAEMLSMIVLNDAIPLQQRIQMRRVSKQWQEIVEGNLKKRTKLAIYGRRTAERRSANDLVVSDAQFTGKFVEQIHRLFPAIADLKMETFSKASYQLLSKMLAPYRATLTSLSLSGFEFTSWVNKPFSTTQRLITALNALPHLTSLQLAGYTFNEHLLQALAPTLLRLERLVFNCNCRRWHDWRSFGRLLFALLSERCTHLKLSTSYQELSGAIHRLGATLTSLDIISSVSGHTLGRICQEFTALRSLCISIHPLDKTSFGHLARLQQLTDLELFDTSTYTEPRFFPAPSDTDPRLTTVRRLKIDLWNFRYAIVEPADVHYFCISMTAWFPTLERLTFSCFQHSYTTIKNVVDAFPANFEICIELMH